MSSDPLLSGGPSDLLPPGDTVAARFDTLLSTISAGVFATDTVGRVTYANPSTLRVLGFTTEQLIGRTPEELGVLRFDVSGRPIEPRNAPLATAGRDRIGTVGAVIRYSGLSVPDVWLESQTTPLYDADGTQQGNVVSFVDVTDRFRLEAERLAGEEQLHDVLRLMVVGVMLVDTEGRIEYANAAAMGERAAAEVIGQLAADPSWNLCDDQRQPVPYEQLPVPTVLREQRAVNDVQLGVPLPDGGMRWMQVNATPRFSASGTLRGAVVTVEDVTERRQLAEQLSQAQKIEAIGLLAGGVAHDFNNLLTAILGNADLALGELASGPGVRAMIAEIRDAATRGSALTRQLLTFARKQVEQPQPVSLDQLTCGIERLLRRLIGEHIVLRRDGDDERDGSTRGDGSPSGARLWPVMIDPGQMEQVIVNLAINARDAMPNGGTLTLATRNVTIDARQAAPHPGVTAGDFVLLEVCDTGVGMSDEIKAHVFDPFFTTKPTGSGSGLGLSICHGVVKQAHGFIAVDSALGKGTTVSVYLPRSTRAVAALGADAAVPPRTGQDATGTIMLVEDDNAVRELVARVLRTAGYQVLVMPDGDAAIAEFERLTAAPDMLVTDIIMPGRGGPEVVRIARRRFPGLPVLFTTGYTDPTVVSDLPLDSSTGVLLKPFTSAQLLERVTALMTS